ncbi:MAG: peptidoglycan-binding protein [Spirochaetaceae bacterium]|jgi:hypothetical protein|nr:peptidoglycan-binding protein [Spirochaetaceae bacterium]
MTEHVPPEGGGGLCCQGRPGCCGIIDKIVESSGDEPLPLFFRIRVFLHLLLCRECAEKAKNFEALREIMKTDFFPPSPGLEKTIMAKLPEEAGEEAAFPGMVPDVPGGVSTLGWVIIGFFILISLATSFFGLGFVKVADAEGSSFLLPVGITIGAVLTGYGVLFIGSHLKELSARFRLH